MAQIISRGDNVYACDVCARRARIPANRHGIEVIHRCVITQSCSGKMHRLSQLKDVNNTPATTPAVTGVQDWFQRRVLYTHTQAIESNKWTVVHNLGSYPTVQVLRGVVHNGALTYSNYEPVKVEPIDLNTILITFATPTSGIAQCTSQLSQNNVNPVVSDVARIAPDSQVTNSGEITIATRESGPVNLVGRYRNPSSGVEATVDFIAIDNTASVLSAWAGIERVIVENNTLFVRSFNILPANGAPLPAAGTQLMFDGFLHERGQLLILLSNPPHSVTDRIRTKYVDATSLDNTQPTFYYSSGEYYMSPTITRSTYPHILTVDVDA